MDTTALHPFFVIAIILMLGAILGAIGLFLRQPLIVVFIALGILVGPSGINVTETTTNIEMLSDLGIALLLFVVGLKLDINLIKSTGRIALYTGLGQVIFTSVIGFIIALSLQYDVLTSLYIAIALTFSSTIIIVKLLSDKKEIDSLHGQIAIGFLIVQDLVVVLLMLFLKSLETSGTSQIVQNTLIMFAKGGLIIIVLGLLMRFVIPKLIHYLARNRELLVLFSIAWAVTVAAGSEFLGFSREVGAFLAGVSLASTSYRNVISGRLVTLRDFLLLFFFIHLGLHLNLQLIGDQVQPALYFSLFVLVGNPLIVMIIMGVMGYRKRTSFLAGLTVAQISEFSLLFAALGLQLGHINEEAVGLITLVGLITIGISTYMILYSHDLFNLLSPFLNVFERKLPFREDLISSKEDKPIDVVLIGLGRFGGNIAVDLQRDGITLLAVDFDPNHIKYWQKRGFLVQYGDLEDPELPDQLPLQQARTVISSIADTKLNLALIQTLKLMNYSGKIAVTAFSSDDAIRLQNANADFVFLPFAEAAEIVSRVMAGKQV
ncbi:cation:proton antiporter [Pontibacter locisalis]|uniref:Cation:proton antiporter n=1 Tax=Pontibacter locisalis TaxID=1719035 RepID=A0ABW5IRI8_9BACT